MKTLSCLLFFTSLVASAYSQKIKRLDVCTGPYKTFYITAMVSFIDDKPHDTTFVVTGRNHRYTHITDLITLKSGNFNEVWNFLTYCMEFLNKEDDGTSELVKGEGSSGGNLITVYQLMGVKGLQIHGQDREVGYTGFNLKYLDKALSCLEEWEQKNSKP